MTKEKDFKRLIRARMEKTGESFTAARANLLAKSPPPLPDDYESIAGKSDATMVESTGKSWPEWVAILDRARAASMEHGVIARWVVESFEVSGWWSQSITVGYERLRGLRDVGQRRGGRYEVSKSKTIAVPVDELWRAFENARVRRRWLPDEAMTIRTATAHKSMRARLADDTPVDVYFTAKGDAKSSVTLQVREIPDREAADAAKARWAERLDTLATILTGS